MDKGKMLAHLPCFEVHWCKDQGVLRVDDRTNIDFRNFKIKPIILKRKKKRIRRIFYKRAGKAIYQSDILWIRERKQRGY